LESVCKRTEKGLFPDPPCRTVIPARQDTRAIAKLRAETWIQFHHLATLMSSNISHFFLASYYVSPHDIGFSMPPGPSAFRQNP
jgi:hypothetical protein